MKSAILLFVAVLFTSVIGINSAMAKPKPVVPFCPCFTAKEIKATLAGSKVIACQDIRHLARPTDLLITSVTTDNGFGDPGFEAAIFGQEDSTGNNVYSCSLGDGITLDLVGIKDIGLTNAMACRLTIINSSPWKKCPPAP
jgi:hypothetical protein